MKRRSLHLSAELASHGAQREYREEGRLPLQLLVLVSRKESHRNKRSPKLEGLGGRCNTSRHTHDFHRLPTSRTSGRPSIVSCLERNSVVGRQIKNKTLTCYYQTVCVLSSVVSIHVIHSFWTAKHSLTPVVAESVTL